MLPFDQKFLILDIESRHLSLLINDGSVENGNAPWDLAWIEAKGNFIQKEYQYYIDIPNLNLSDLVKKLTNFDEQKYNKEKKPAEFVLEKFKKFLYDPEYIIIGQNILKFDIFLCSDLWARCGEKIDWSFVDRIYDTRPLALAYKNNLEKPRNGSIIEWQYKILNDKSLKGRVSQTSLLKEFDLQSTDEGSRHSALTDIRDTFNIFKELKKRLEL